MTHAWLCALRMIVLGPDLCHDRQTTFTTQVAIDGVAPLTHGKCTIYVNEKSDDDR